MNKKMYLSRFVWVGAVNDQLEMHNVQTDSFLLKAKHPYVILEIVFWLHTCIAHCIFHVTSKPCGLRLVFVRQLTGPSVLISMAYSRFSSRKRDGQPTWSSASPMLLGPELWSCGWERGSRKNSETCQYSPASVSSGQSSNQVIITVGWWNGPPVFS